LRKYVGAVGVDHFAEEHDGMAAFVEEGGKAEIDAGF
jgi:hypothetical protein